MERFLTVFTERLSVSGFTGGPFFPELSFLGSFREFRFFRHSGLPCLLLFGQTGLVAQRAAAAGGQVILLEAAVTSAELIVSAVKYLILAEFAGQGSVKESCTGIDRYEWLYRSW